MDKPSPFVIQSVYNDLRGARSSLDSTTMQIGTLLDKLTQARQQQLNLQQKAKDLEKWLEENNPNLQNVGFMIDEKNS